MKCPVMKKGGDSRKRGFSAFLLFCIWPVFREAYCRSQRVQ